MQITRRAALKGGAAVAALGAPLAAISLNAEAANAWAVPVPITRAIDEPLLEMERQWLAYLDYCCNYPDEADEARDPLFARLTEIEFQIHRTPAKSPTGIAVKLRMYGRSHPYYGDVGPWWERPVEDFAGDLDYMPLVSALRDAERLAGGAPS